MAIPVKPKAGDFSGVKDSDFEAIEGVYNAKIGAMEHREAKPETAARYEQKNPGEPYDHRRVWTNVALNAEGMTKQFLQALGYTNDDLNDPNSRINSVGLEPEVEIGKSVRVRCAKSKNDETQTEVKAIMPPLVMSDLPA
jgi:hypothetical protein